MQSAVEPEVTRAAGDGGRSLLIPSWLRSDHHAKGPTLMSLKPFGAAASSPSTQVRSTVDLSSFELISAVIRRIDISRGGCLCRGKGRRIDVGEIGMPGAPAKAWRPGLKPSRSGGGAMKVER